MSDPHIQTVYNDTASGTSVSVTLTLTPGNGVVVTLVIGGIGAPALGQTSGDTLTLVASKNDSGTYQQQSVNYAVAGGSTTFTFSWVGSSSSIGLYVTEVSGLVVSGFDKSASSSFSTSATHSSGTTAALARSREFALATFNGNGSGSNTFVSISNGFTVPTNGSQLTGASNQKAFLAYKVVSSTEPVETTLTTTDPESATGLITTFKLVDAIIESVWDSTGIPPVPGGSHASLTVPATIAGNFAVVCAMVRDDSVFDVTWSLGGTFSVQAQRTAVGPGLQAAIYTLPAPTIGAGNVIIQSIGASSPTYIGGAVLSLNSILQTGFLDDDDATDTTGANPTLPGLTTIADADIVIDCLATNNTVANIMNAETNRVQRANFAAFIQGRYVSVSTIYPKSPAGAVTMGWNIGANNSAYVAIALKVSTGIHAPVGTFDVLVVDRSWFDPLVAR